MSLRSISIFFIFTWFTLAIVAKLPILEPNKIVLEQILKTPSFTAPLGYDDLGRSVASRLIVGSKTSLIVALSVVSISLLVGSLIGMLSAWLGGWWDKMTVMLIDIFMAFPGLLLAIALAGMLGPGLSNTIIALTVVGWVGFARLARAQTLSLKNREHIQAAQSLGTETPIILSKHIFPLLLAPMVIQASFEVAGAIIAEATLSFLGLGIQAPHASWGSMIRDGVSYMLVAPHMVLAPGLAVFLLVFSLNYLGDSLRDSLDVRLK